MGFDDVDIANLTYPTLTTIKQPIEEMCKYAVECIAKEIKGETVPIKMVMNLVLMHRAKIFTGFCMHRIKFVDEERMNSFSLSTDEAHRCMDRLHSVFQGLCCR